MVFSLLDFSSILLDFVCKTSNSRNTFFAETQVIEANGAPCVIHCAAGKDRTGVAMAFILLACGVGVKEVLDDYELSNVHNAFRCAQVRHVLSLNSSQNGCMD